jgi:hypothetical protein
MNCEECRAAIEETAAFCRRCGTPVRKPTVDQPPSPGPTECRECGAAVRAGALFCASCGTRRQGAGPDVSDAPTTPLGVAPEPVVTGATLSAVMTDAAPPIDNVPDGPQPAPALAAPTDQLPSAPAPGPYPWVPTTPGMAFMLPHVPFKLLWTARRPWKVTTALSEETIADLFRERMSKKPNVVLRANSYFRRARWEITRDAISGEVVARCNPTGLVAIGVGDSKHHVDVSGDTIVLETSREGDAQTHATVGAGTFTTWFGLYMFPATVYAFDVVKAIKRADRTAHVHYPWSIVRIALVTLAVLAILASVASSGSGRSTTGGGTAALPVAPPPVAAPAQTATDPEQTATEPAAPVDTTTTPVTGDTTPQPASAAGALPDATDDEMAAQIQRVLLSFHQDIVNRDFRAAWQLLSSRKRHQFIRENGYARWRTAQASLSDHLSPDAMTVELKDSNPATGVAQVAMTGMGWSKPGARCDEWSGLTWMKYEGNRWTYDPGYSTTPQRERAWKSRFEELLGGSC